MMRSLGKAIVFILFVATVSGCNKGVSPTGSSPPVVQSGFISGMIRYRNWPPADSLHDLRIVAFRIFPPTNILNEVIQGRAMVYPALGDTAHLPYFVDSLSYTFAVPAGEYQYVVVAQQFGPAITTDWRAVGQYDLDSNLTVPSAVMILANDTTRSVNINVDFTNPPPPPF